jgi:hypothetical protein
MAENNEDKKNDLLQVCLEYLERYYVLIVFTAFLFGPSFDPSSPDTSSFKQWRDERHELQRCLSFLLCSSVVLIGSKCLMCFNVVLGS